MTEKKNLDMISPLYYEIWIDEETHEKFKPEFIANRISKIYGTIPPGVLSDKFGFLSIAAKTAAQNLKVGRKNCKISFSTDLVIVESS